MRIKIGYIGIIVGFMVASSAGAMDLSSSSSLEAEFLGASSSSTTSVLASSGSEHQKLSPCSGLSAASSASVLNESIELKRFELSSSSESDQDQRRVHFARRAQRRTYQVPGFKGRPVSEIRLKVKERGQKRREERARINAEWADRMSIEIERTNNMLDISDHIRVLRGIKSRLEQRLFDAEVARAEERARGGGVICCGIRCGRQRVAPEHDDGNVSWLNHRIHATERRIAIWEDRYHRICHLGDTLGADALTW